MIFETAQVRNMITAEAIKTDFASILEVAKNTSGYSTTNSYMHLASAADRNYHTLSMLIGGLEKKYNGNNAGSSPFLRHFIHQALQVYLITNNDDYAYALVEWAAMNVQIATDMAHHGDGKYSYFDDKVKAPFIWYARPNDAWHASFGSKMGFFNATEIENMTKNFLYHFFSNFKESAPKRNTVTLKILEDINKAGTGNHLDSFNIILDKDNLTIKIPTRVKNDYKLSLDPVINLKKKKAVAK